MTDSTDLRPRAVVDANLWVSASLFERSLPTQVIELDRDRAMISLVSKELLDQGEPGLHRLHFSSASVRTAMPEMINVSVMVAPVLRLAVITAKESDSRVLECAVAGKADLIITGDRKHLLPLESYAGIRIVTPAGFLASLS